MLIQQQEMLRRRSLHGYTEVIVWLAAQQTAGNPPSGLNSNTEAMQKGQQPSTPAHEQQRCTMQAHLVPRCFTLAHGSRHGVSTPVAASDAASEPAPDSGPAMESASTGARRGEAASAAAMSSSAGARSALDCMLDLVSGLQLGSVSKRHMELWSGFIRVKIKVWARVEVRVRVAFVDDNH